MQIIMVMAGGFLGAVSRFALGEWVHINGFPLNTLLINLAGCLFLGWFLTYISQLNSTWRNVSLAIGTGFIGSFTTFSTFSMETIEMIRDGLIFFSVLYVVASVIGGLMLVYVGIKLAVFQDRGGAA